MLTSRELDFQQVYETYQPRVLRFLIRLVGPDEAEELSQEVFLRADRALAGFRGDAQVSTWLYRIAAHAAIDRVRSASYRRDKQNIDLEAASAAGQILSVGCGGAGPAGMEQALFRQERADCFLGFLDQLPLGYRTVLLLKEVEDLTTAEIAEILELSQETVKIRLHRGRAKLFQALKEHCKPEEWL